VGGLITLPFHDMIKSCVKITALLLFFCFIGCSFRTDRRQIKEFEPTNPVLKNEENFDTTVGTAADNGDFIVEYVNSQLYPKYESELRSNKVLEKAADRLNQSLALPQDVKIRVQDCSSPDASYDPKTKTIKICFNLIEHFTKLFFSETADETSAYQKAFEATRFVFLHELGHALIDVYSLPVTGNEEDAADRLSTFVCLDQLGDEGIKSILSAAEAFRIEAKSQVKRNLADDHLLQEQRFYNSLCLIYGSDPDKYSRFVTDKYLPIERARKCPEEYEKMVRSWTELLAPWRR